MSAYYRRLTGDDPEVSLMIIKFCILIYQQKISTNILNRYSSLCVYLSIYVSTSSLVFKICSTED